MTDWQTISRLYHQAMSRETGERAALLDAASAGDDRLRRQVESLAEPGDRQDTDNMVNRLVAGFGRLLAELNTTSEKPWHAKGGDDPPRDETTSSIQSQAYFKSSPLSVLGPATLGELFAAMEPREFAPGEYLMRQGDPADCLFLVLNGSAWAHVRDAPSGRPPVGVFGPGDVVGEISLVTDEPRTAEVVAQTSVLALRLSSTDFHTIAQHHPDVRVVLTDVVASRLGQTRYDGLGGKDIHGYRIVQCIGRGGMGVVYEAKESATGKTVALKMMNHRLVYQPRAVRRFKREADILKTLHHPALARLYECFSAYKTEFLAMEFCNGSTLGEVIATRGPLGEDSVRALLGQLAVALRYIHERGVVHRDLKPSNIIISQDGRIKLLDFGIGTFDHESELWRDHSSGSTRSSEVLGTPRYMAPEQFSNGNVDHRSDFYGLACVAFEALTGRTVVKASDILGIVLEQERFVLPARRRIGKGVSAEMHDLLRHGLKHNPEERRVDLDLLATWAGPVDLGPPSRRLSD